jgi:hypothetical protein
MLSTLVSSDPLVYGNLGIDTNDVCLSCRSSILSSGFLQRHPRSRNLHRPLPTQETRRSSLRIPRLGYRCPLQRPHQRLSPHHALVSPCLRSLWRGCHVLVRYICCCRDRYVSPPSLIIPSLLSEKKSGYLWDILLGMDLHPSETREVCDPSGSLDVG